MEGYHRLWFHDERRNEVQHYDGPKPTQKQEYNCNGPRPEEGKIKIIGNASTYA
jgi:hypothetical protein